MNTNDTYRALPEDLDGLKKALDLMHHQFDISTSNKKSFEYPNPTSKKNKTLYLKEQLDVAMKEYRKKINSDL